MQLGLAISLVLHLGILAWALVSIQATPELRAPDVTPIEVAIVTPSELTRLKQGNPDAKELEAKAKEEPQPPSKEEAPKPKPITAPPPPPPPPAPPPPEEAKTPEPPKAEPAKPEPPPEPKADPIADKLAALPAPPEPEPGPSPEELKRLEDERQAEESRKEEERRKAEEQKKAEEKRKAEEKKKAEELKKKKEEEKKLAEAKRKAEEAKKKQQFDADRIAALIDKTPDKRGAPPSATPPTQPTTHTGPTAGERSGRDTVLSAREQDLLKGKISAQLRGCWRLPGGGGGIETVVVTVHWRLRPDGSLDGEPEVERPQASPVFQIAAEAAVRAVKACAPFALPPDKYSAWRAIIWDFDPREML
jgi:colicin import membrane protein